MWADALRDGLCHHNPFTNLRLETPKGRKDITALTEAEIEQLDHIAREHHGDYGNEIAALIVEPMIKAAGGMIIYPAAYLQGLRELCTQYEVHLIADEVQNRGTIDHTPVYPREIIKRALELGASSLILAHNHPSGDPTPSKADIAMTREVAVAAKALGISLHDHLVVGRGGHASFKSLGLL